jgi:hypothetical protein
MSTLGFPPHKLRNAFSRKTCLVPDFGTLHHSVRHDRGGWSGAECGPTIRPVMGHASGSGAAAGCRPSDSDRGAQIGPHEKAGDEWSSGASEASEARRPGREFGGHGRVSMTCPLAVTVRVDDAHVREGGARVMPTACLVEHTQGTATRSRGSGRRPRPEAISFPAFSGRAATRTRPAARAKLLRRMPAAA